MGLALWETVASYSIGGIFVGGTYLHILPRVPRNIGFISVGFICAGVHTFAVFFLSVHINISFPFSVTIVDDKCLL